MQFCSNGVLGSYIAMLQYPDAVRTEKELRAEFEKFDAAASHQHGITLSRTASSDLS